jgi:autophagy-related protein 18
MNRKRLLVVLEDQIYIYALKNMELLHVLPVRSNPGGVCALSQNLLHPFLAYPGNNPGEVIIFNTDSLEPVTVISAHKSNLAIVSFNPPPSKNSKDDKLLLATASEKGTLIRVFDVATAQRLYEFRRGSMPTTIFSINFEPKTNKYLIVSSATDTVHMFKLGEPAKARLRPSSSEAEPWAISGSGRANKYFSSVLKMLEPQRDYTCLKIPTNGNTNDASGANGGRSKPKNLGGVNHVNRESKSAAAFCKDMVVVVTSEGYLYQFKFRSPEFKDGELVQQYSLTSM